jgi:hypothetical protein
MFNLICAGLVKCFGSILKPLRIYTESDFLFFALQKLLFHEDCLKKDFLIFLCIIQGLAAPFRGEKKEEARGGAGEEEGGEAAEEGGAQAAQVPQEAGDPGQAGQAQKDHRQRGDGAQ